MVGEEFPVVYIRYYDHHWFTDKQELSEILAKQDTNTHGVIVTEVGLFIAQDSKSIIMAHERNEDLETDPPKITFDNVTRIMRSDIITMREFKL